MRSTYMTRRDPDVGHGDYDSIAWALGVHVGIPDTGEFQTAMLHGNEDSPDRIEFWKSEEPNVGDEPDFVWTETERGRVGDRQRGSK